MFKWLALVAVVVLGGQVALAEGDLSVEASKEAPPADVLVEEIAAEIAPTGYKVVDGDKKLVCEIWLAKNWTLKPGFQPSLSILYPLEPGSLVGVLRFTRKGTDFRGQDIARGVYTLRYANQPEDGNHVGTFETRDFLVMLPAAADTSLKTLPDTDLFKVSAEAAGSTHPAIMPLLKAEEGKDAAVRHLADQEWWALHVLGTDAKGGKHPLDVIVQGKSAE